MTDKQENLRCDLRHPRSLVTWLFSKNVQIQFLWLNLGTFLIAVGIYFFKYPNNFNTGGISGLSVVMGKIMPSISPAQSMFILNLILLLVGYLVLGKGFGFMTTYSTIAMSGMIWLFEKIYPLKKPMSNQPILELFFAILLSGLGAAILFNIHASNGGTDIIGMILKKYTNINIGTALGLTDLGITLLNFYAFGATSGLFSLFGLVVKATLTDHVIESLNLHKYYTIITAKSDEVVSFITATLHRSATLSHAEGAFTGQPKVIIMTVLKRSQGILLQQFIHEVDPHAFLFITNTSEIIGKGFGGIN